MRSGEKPPPLAVSGLSEPPNRIVRPVAFISELSARVTAAREQNNRDHILQSQRLTRIFTDNSLLYALSNHRSNPFPDGH